MSKKTNWKLGLALSAVSLAAASSVLADPAGKTTYVNSLIKCHEAKFEFDDATGELNSYFMDKEVGDYAGYIHTSPDGTQINPEAQPVAIRAPFTASAPTFVKDSHGVFWACVTLNSVK